MFKFDDVAGSFDEHIQGQLFWHRDFITRFLPEIASYYMEAHSVVYDFGASTGNVELALKGKCVERSVDFRPVEKCPKMAEAYKGDRSRLVVDDFLRVELEEFSFATSILALTFVHPSNRPAFIARLKAKCKLGGAFVFLEKMTNYGGYIGTALNRVIWSNKLSQGESLDMVVNKELSLSGVQFPLSENEVAGFKLLWAYGNFRAYIWEKEF
jgi:tRNA (cmo5U34)-methyltransferase